jgi:predicted metal-dependent peptidase
LSILDTDKLSAARFRVAHELPYLAAALFSLQTISTPTLPSQTMAVDERLRLYVAPRFVDAHPVEELAGVIAHEVLHVVFDHGARARTIGVTTREAGLWNLACDAAINQILSTSPTRTGGPLPLPDPVLPQHLGFGERRDATAEEMYLHLAGQVRPIGEEHWAAWRECGSGAHGIVRPWEDAASDAGVVGLQAAAVELVRRRVAADIADAVRTQGVVAGGLCRWAHQVGHPTVDWRRELRALVRSGIGSAIGQVVPSYARPSRRSSTSGGVILPSLRAPSPTVAVVIDTSGSMGGDDLDQALGELAGILRASAVRRVRVWACDVAAYEVTLRGGFSDLELNGGGGTDLGVGIDAATTQKGFKPDVIVVLTDGGTNWPEHPPRAKVIVGLVGAHAIDTTPVWAHMVRIEASAR